MQCSTRSDRLGASALSGRVGHFIESLEFIFNFLFFCFYDKEIYWQKCKGEV